MVKYGHRSQTHQTAITRILSRRFVSSRRHLSLLHAEQRVADVTTQAARFLWAAEHAFFCIATSLTVESKGVVVAVKPPVPEPQPHVRAIEFMLHK
jgi:hypothetical protein